MDQKCTWHPGEGHVLLVFCLDRDILAFGRLSSRHHAPPNVSTPVPLMAHFHADRNIKKKTELEHLLLWRVNSFILLLCSEQKRATWSPISI